MVKIKSLANGIALALIAFGAAPTISMAEVGDVTREDVSTVSCSVSICKNSGETIHTSNWQEQKLCEENDPSINWVTEEIVGTGELDVLEQFRDLYYVEGQENSKPNTFDTLVKRNWACGENRESSIGLFGSDVPNPEDVLRKINPHIKVSLSNYNIETKEFSFSNPRYEGPGGSGRISVGNGDWNKDNEESEFCPMMGFREGISINYGSSSGGDIVYINPDGSFDQNKSNSDFVVTSVTCKGDITKVFYQ